MRYADVWPKYKVWWDEMTINNGFQPTFNVQAQWALSHKDRYLDIEKITGVKWYHIAVLHRRESDANFGTYLGNGEPLNRVTRLVPRGRGPFASFEAGAIDALRIDGLSSVKDWRLEKILYYCELFNGVGYYLHGLPSPYVWGGTNIQRPGKYVADGVWNGTVMDTQPGCAPLLYTIAKLDPTVELTRETA